MFEFRKTCSHDKISPEKNSGYCPDCGEYVENKWYITRCSCCGVKQKTRVMKGKILAEERFCRNCGGSSFAVEELENIDIVNINYAVVMKKTGGIRRQSFIQTWIEKNAIVPMKLLPSY